MKKFLLSLAAGLLGLTASAGEISLLWGADYWNKNSTYTGSLTSNVEFGGSKWTLEAFNNNSNGWENVRCGRKENASVASIFNNTALDYKVTSITMNTKLEKDADNGKINSVKLVISKSEDFSNPVEVAFEGFTTYGDWTINVPAENADYGYYKVVFDLASAANNGFLGINSFVVNVEGDVEGDNPGGETPEQPEQPGDGEGNIVQQFTTNLGFPDKSADAPKTATQYTATDTEIEYTLLGCYTNSGYLMVPGKTTAGSYISWSLDMDMSNLIMTTSSGCSTNANSKVNVYANEQLIGNYQVNAVSTDYVVEIPEEYQAAGTVYKVESGTTSYNQQFASFTYVKAGNEVEIPEQPEQPEAPEGVITVAEALDLIGQGYQGPATVKGIISEITDMSTQYGNATYNIVDAIGNTNVLVVFRGYGLNGEKFVTGDEIAVGGTVTVEGELVNYNGTKEFTTGSKILEYTAPEGGETPEQPGDDDDDEAVTINWSEMDYANAQGIEKVEVGDITLTFDKASGSTAPAYYNTGAAIRLYGGNTMTISVPEGTALAKIVFTTATGNNAFNDASTVTTGEFNIGENTWTATSNNVGSVMFTQGGTSGHVRIMTTTIYLQEAGDDERVEVGNEPAPEVKKYTVAEALAMIENNEIPKGAVQVEGIITKISELSTQYGNATYVIKDKESDENGLTIFRGNWLNGEKFTTGNEIEVGGLVIVEGTLVYYQNTTPEMNQGNKIVKYLTPGELTGVEMVESIKGEAEYYDLNGRKVANPDKGIYIKVEGKKAVKVVK